MAISFYNTIRAMHKCVVFLLTVIACSHLVFSVEGRLIKSVSKIDPKHAMHKADQPAAPTYVPNAAHHSVSASGKKVLPPPMPTKGSDFDHDSVTGYSDAFRPTTPGNSPGAGHSYVDDDEEIERKSGSINPSNDKRSIAEGSKVNCRTSTSPGHSPGVGHAFLSKISKPNA